MMLLINDPAIDVSGLWKTAYRLNRRTTMGVDKIFFRLLRARVEYLGRTNNLVVLKG